MVKTYLRIQFNIKIFNNKYFFFNVKYNILSLVLMKDIGKISIVVGY